MRIRGLEMLIFVRVRIRGLEILVFVRVLIRNVSFLEYFAYVLNGWPAVNLYNKL